MKLHIANSILECKLDCDYSYLCLEKWTLIIQQVIVCPNFYSAWDRKTLRGQRKTGWDKHLLFRRHCLDSLDFLGAVVLFMLILLCKNRDNNQIIGNSCTTMALLPAFPFSVAVPKIPRVNSVKIHIFSSVTFTLFLCYFTEKSKQTDV